MIQCRNCNEKINDMLTHRHICLKENKVKWSGQTNPSSNPPILDNNFLKTMNVIKLNKQKKESAALTKNKIIKRRWCNKCDKLFKIDGDHKNVCPKCRVHKSWLSTLKHGN